MFNENLKAFVVINKADSNPSMTLMDAMTEYLSEFKEMKLLSSQIVNRAVHRKALAEGLSVAEYRPLNRKAAAELDALVLEVANA